MAGVGPKARTSVWYVVLFGVPAAVLVGSYAWLALDHGTLHLAGVTVHESGRYTLGQTVFYWDHFLREVPTCVCYALFVVAGYVGTGRPYPDGRPGRSRLMILGGGAVAVGIVAAAFAVSAAEHGWHHAWVDFAQYRTRDDLAAYGSHWHFHWLSTLWFGATAMWLGPWANPFRRSLGGGVPRLSGTVWVAWGAFGLLTLVWGVSAEVFVDVRYAGHQAREIVTHGPITGLLCLGVVMLADQGLTSRSGARSRAGGGMSHGWPWLVLVVTLPLYAAAVTLNGDALAAGQSDAGLAAMVAAHVFEHSLDYVFTAGLTLALFGVVARVKTGRVTAVV